MNENLYSEIVTLGKQIAQFQQMLEKECGGKSKYELSISKRLESNVLWVQLDCMQDLFEVLTTRAKMIGMPLPSAEEMGWKK